MTSVDLSQIGTRSKWLSAKGKREFITSRKYDMAISCKITSHEVDCIHNMAWSFRHSSKSSK